MAITYGTCVSFCNQPKAHFGLPCVRPGTIAINVTRMKRGFNASQMHRSMYPSIFNHFPVIQPVSSKVHHFSTFFAHFGLIWVRPWDNRRKFTWMERGFNAGRRIAEYTHLSLTVYELYSEILVRNCNFFLPTCI